MALRSTRSRGSAPVSKKSSTPRSIPHSLERSRGTRPEEKQPFSVFRFRNKNVKRRKTPSHVGVSRRSGKMPPPGAINENAAANARRLDSISYCSRSFLRLRFICDLDNFSVNPSPPGGVALCCWCPGDGAAGLAGPGCVSGATTIPGMNFLGGAAAACRCGGIPCTRGWGMPRGAGTPGRPPLCCCCCC